MKNQYVHVVKSEFYTDRETRTVFFEHTVEDLVTWFRNPNKSGPVPSLTTYADLWKQELLLLILPRSDFLMLKGRPEVVATLSSGMDFIDTCLVKEFQGERECEFQLFRPKFIEGLIEEHIDFKRSEFSLISRMKEKRDSNFPFDGRPMSFDDLREYRDFLNSKDFSDKLLSDLHPTKLSFAGENQPKVFRLSHRMYFHSSVFKEFLSDPKCGVEARYKTRD